MIHKLGCDARRLRGRETFLDEARCNCGIPIGDRLLQAWAAVLDGLANEVDRDEQARRHENMRAVISAVRQADSGRDEARAIAERSVRERDALALLVADAGFAWSATDPRVKMTTGERLALALTACEEASKGWHK